MELIQTFLPITPKEYCKLELKYNKKLKRLFRVPYLKENIEKIKKEFVSDFTSVGTTYKFESEEDETEYRNKFLKRVSLSYDNNVLKDLRLSIKSQKKEFQKKITNLMRKFEIPEKFRSMLTQYIIYGKFHLEVSDCLLHIFNDKSKNRIFIEVTGDSKKKHLKKAWRLVKKIRKRYNINTKRHGSIVVFDLDNTKRLFVEIFKNTKKEDLEAIYKDVQRAIVKYNIPGDYLFRYNDYLYRKFESDNKFCDPNFDALRLARLDKKSYKSPEDYLKEQKARRYRYQKEYLGRNRYKKYLEERKTVK